MKRAATYERFSTDLQNDRSNDDQYISNLSFAKGHEFSCILDFRDEALSGTSIKNRPGMQGLLAAAKAGEFDVLIVDATSRIGRDQEDRAYIRKRMEYWGIVIMTPEDGVVTDMIDGVRAVVDSQQIRDLRHAVRRGQRGRILEGKVAGGRCYGYDLVKGEPGRRIVNEEQAEVIRRIFSEFVAGRSPRAICAGLNRDGVAPPRGNIWRASTLNGSGQRGYGILRNSIYTGILTWNRVHMVKDPDSEKQGRTSRINDRATWVTHEVPELAIIDRAIYAAVQKRKSDLAHVYPGRQKRPKRILSGLLRCGCCGAGMSAYGPDSTGRTRIRCSAAKEGGACPAPKTFYLDVIERTVLDKLRGELAHPEAIAEFVRAYHEEYRRLTQSAGMRRTKIERRLGDIEREITRLVDAIARGHGDPAILGPKSTALDAERKGLSAELATIEEPKVITLHPTALARYEQSVARLQAAIDNTVSGGDTEAAEAMRELIETVTVHRTAEGAAEIVIAGRLNSLIGIPAFPSGQHSLCRKVVAGARYSHSPQLKILRFEVRAVA